MTDDEAKAFCDAKWERLRAPENAHSQLTQHLPADVVRQDLAIWVYEYTDPENDRNGYLGTAMRFGERDNPDLTPDEAEYVASTLMSSARQVMKKYGARAKVQIPKDWSREDEKAFRAAWQAAGGNRQADIEQSEE